MGVNPGDVNVLVPVPNGAVVVCDLIDLLVHLDDADTLYEVMENVGFDQADDLKNEGTVARVRQLNLDNDAKKYWGME